MKISIIVYFVIIVLLYMSQAVADTTTVTVYEGKPTIDELGDRLDLIRNVVLVMLTIMAINLIATIVIVSGIMGVGK